jgi:hypothetical protein
VPTLDQLVRGITHGAHAAAASIPNLIAGILRLNLIAVSLIYAGALTLEFWSRPETFLLATLIAVSVSLFFVLAVLIFVKTLRAQWKRQNVPAADLGSVWACATPAAIAIIATAIIGCWEPARFQFHEPLLKETAYQAGRFVYWITIHL